MYYVYQWIDNDTGRPFYVGKGTGDRMRSLKNRSKQFLDYIGTHPNCEPEIIVDGLDEESAFEIEAATISEYKTKGFDLVNIAYGGRGGIHLFGSDNPMFGRTWYDENTPQSKIDAWKEAVAHRGKDNAMYGVSPSERMDTETYTRWRESHKRITGDKNPNYGNHKLSEYYKEHPEEAIAKQSRPGVTNGRCMKVDAIYPDGTMHHFDYMIACAEAISQMCGVNNIQYLATKISEHAKSGKPYKGFYFSR